MILVSVSDFFISPGDPEVEVVTAFPLADDWYPPPQIFSHQQANPTVDGFAFPS